MRLFRVAFMASFVLLVNLALTISTSVVLEDWSRASDAWLVCELDENQFSRDWDSYGLKEGGIVCSAEAAVPCADCYDETGPCKTSCVYRESALDFFGGGSKKGPGLECEATYFRSGVSKEARCDCKSAFNPQNGSTVFKLLAHVCNLGSCEDFVEIKVPSAWMMALSHLSQSFVVVIVGINMGLRLDF
jgi:hypothetical protein